MQTKQHKTTMKYQILIGLFILFFASELIVGIASNSLSLQADAFHLLGDILALGIGFTSQKLSLRTPTESHTYGWLRSPIIGSVINTTFLLSVCFTLTIEIIQRFFIIEETEIKHINWVLGVGVGGLIVNILGIVLFSNNHGNHDHGEHSVFLHLLGDTLGSLVVICNALLIKFVKDVAFIRYIDPIASFIIVCFLVVSSVKLLRKSIAILLHISPIDTSQLIKSICEIEKVMGVHHLHLWSLDESTTISTFHVDVSPSRCKSSKIIHQINLMLHIQYNIHNSVIQIEKRGECLDCIDKECDIGKCCRIEN